VVKTKQYSYHWDRLRLIAMLAIVGFHINGSFYFGGIGLPTFLILSITLSVARRKAIPTQEFVVKRVKRILLPWLFWCVVFGIFLIARMLWNQDETDRQWFTWNMLLCGTELHLWFLPFIGIVGVAVHLIQLATARVSDLLLASIALPMVVVLFPFLSHLVLYSCPFREWLFSIPALPLGFGFGRLVAHSGHPQAAQVYAAFFTAGFLLLCGALAAVDPDTLAQTRQYALSLVLLTEVLWLPDQQDPVNATVGPLLMGLYILHPLVNVQIIMRVVRISGWNLDGWPLLLLVSALTLGIVALVRRTPIKAVL